MQHSDFTSAAQSGLLGDYMLNARAWISIDVSRDIELELDEVCFITGGGPLPTYGGRLVDAADLHTLPPSCYQVYEPVRADRRALRLREAHSRVALYTWGDPDFTLPTGSRRATLIDDDRLLQLHCGDVLVFEQVLGAASGLEADADPGLRHAVRLTGVEPIVDAANGGRELLAIEWHADDRLPFSLPVAQRTAAGAIDGITVVCANVVLVDHGRTIREALAVGESGPDGAASLVLSRGPLVFADPAPAGSAAAAFERDSRLAMPQVSGIAIAPDHSAASPPALAWEARADLEASGPDDRHFVARQGPDGRTRLLFGDGAHGARLACGTVFIARYRVGQAAAGIVEREQIAYMVMRKRHLPDIVIAPRNPMPVWRRAGTRGREQPVRRYRPANGGCEYADEDFAAGAMRHPLVRQAVAWRHAAGSGHVVHVVADTRASSTPAWLLRQEVEAMLAPFLPAQHALKVVRAERVPLRLELRVRLQSGARQDAVRHRLIELFSEGEQAPGQPAFFHPERRRLGQPVYAWSILSMAASVPGVDSVSIARLARLDDAEGETEWGVLRIGRGEIATLGGDARHPGRGVLGISFVD